jgi:hypothetical protein
MADNIPCIGLFGTCGGSRWRDPFVAAYRERGIRWFNPQVDNWTPECADIEAQHLARDEIILFPVTGETYGTGSLAETGFSLLQAVRTSATRYVVFMIEQALAPELMGNEAAAKESLRARKLVAAHLNENRSPNAFKVDSLEAMLELSVDLWGVADRVGELHRRYG